MENSKGNAPPGERGPDAKLAEAIRARIEAIAKMFKAGTADIDLGDIWESDDFRDLPEEDRRALKAWAVEKGYMPPDDGGEDAAPEKGTPRADALDPAAEPVKRKLETLAKMFKAGTAEPDFSDIWESDEFKELPDASRRALRAWGREQGEPEHVDDAPVSRAPEAAAHDRQGTVDAGPARPETREGDRERRPRRRFIGYRVERADGNASVVEDFEELDRRSDEYRKRTHQTSIELPPGAAVRMDDRLASELSSYADDVRRGLDEGSGVKMFFDRPKADPDRVYPKWKYAIDGRTVEERVDLGEDDAADADSIPARIIDLVRSNAEYYRTPEWKKWFGKRMQRKREEIITAKLAERYGDPEQERPKAAANAAPAESAERAPASVPERAARKAPELRLALSMLIDAFAPKFDLPNEADKFIEYVRQFGKGTKLREVPDEEFSSAVRDALRERFRDDAVMASKIDAILGPDDAAIEVDDAMIESAEEPPRDPYEGLPKAYRTLRTQLDALRSADDLEQFITSLKELRRSGPGESKDAAKRLLVEIEHGAAGEVTEATVKGLSRSPAERAFFAAHPALDARNAKLHPEGHFIVYTDPVRTGDSLRRTFARLADDALAPDLSDRDELVEGIADYLTNVLTGRGTVEVRQRFAKGLAELQKTGEGIDELVIRDIARLAEVIDALARRVIRDKEGR